MSSAVARVSVAEEQPSLVDILAGYFARTVGGPRADYFAKTVEEQPWLINELADCFDKVVGYLAANSLGTPAGEHMVRSETIVEGQLMMDYPEKSGMCWEMEHWMCPV